MYPENNPRPFSVTQDSQDRTQRWEAGEGARRYPESFIDVADGAYPEPKSEDVCDLGKAKSKGIFARAVGANWQFLPPVLVVVGVAVWCIAVMAIGVNLAESAWAWACVFSFGTAVPAFFLWQANRFLTSPEPSGFTLNLEDKHKALLKVLVECGEITPISAALRTSLTVDEAAGMLDELARKNHLELRAEEGIVVYALRERDRRGLLGTSTAFTQGGR